MKLKIKTVFIDPKMELWPLKADIAIPVNANIAEPEFLYPGEIRGIATGLLIQLPEEGGDQWRWGLEAKSRPSALYKGIIVVDTPTRISTPIHVMNVTGDPLKICPDDPLGYFVLTKQYFIEAE